MVENEPSRFSQLHALETSSPGSRLGNTQTRRDEHAGRFLALIRIFSLRARYRYKPAPLFTMIPVGERPVSAAVAALS
jgi:hypothetical protein